MAGYDDYELDTCLMKYMDGETVPLETYLIQHGALSALPKGRIGRTLVIIKFIAGRTSLPPRYIQRAKDILDRLNLKLLDGSDLE